MIGGIIDFRFILVKGGLMLAQQSFNNLIGAAAIPPFWSMGMHQSRWGYKNVSKLKDVIKNYESNSLPLDTIWSDIDYMQDY